MYKLSFELETELFLRIEKVLLSAGASSITQTDGDCDVFDEPAVRETSSWSRCRMVALFNTEAESNFARSQLREILASVSLKQDKLTDSDWSKSWRNSWSPKTFSEKLCVCPSWLKPPTGVQYLVTLDPGQAFGTGSHETTSLCLSWLVQNLGSVKGAQVIDYGSGSGILGIAAIKLGASHVVGVELDLESILVSRDNACINGVDKKITFAERLELESSGVADVILANILLKPILQLEPVFLRLLKSGGVLLLSGILTSQVKEVFATYQERFSITVTDTDGDWALLTATRRRESAEIG
jgi:ribosomal protein L11 methyltransferase